MVCRALIRVRSHVLLTRLAPVVELNSRRALDNRCHTRRGFLLRGLSNTCPQAGATRGIALRDGQMSDKPKLKPRSAVNR